MARVAFLVPIRPGKREAYLQFAKKLSADQLAPLYRQYGVTTHVAFVGQDVIVSYYEAANPADVRAMWALPAVQEIVRTQMSGLVELDPLDLKFLDVAFDWQEAVEQDPRRRNG
jgi:hypothetical protein